jgi:hypothetical protein
MRLSAVGLIVLHAVVLLGHDIAHRDLGIVLKPWQWAYAYAVIVAAPIAAGVAILARRDGFGFALLAGSMAGALVFTVLHHYVLVSPDHVGHLPAVGDASLFRMTAAALAGLEAAGVLIGARGLRQKLA